MITAGVGGRLKPDAHQRRKRAVLGSSLLPAPPESWAPPAGVVAQLFANDRYGCCTKANLANLLVQQASVGGRELAFTVDQVLASYFASSGGQDSGLCEVDVLAEAEEQSFCGEQLGAVLAIDPLNLMAARSLCALFGGLYVGAELPARAPLQLRAGEAWDVPGAPGATEDIDAEGSWSGHAMYVSAFSADSFMLGTWGDHQRCTETWWRAYVDEAYVVVPRAQLLTATPELLEQLTAILAAAAAEDAAP